MDDIELKPCPFCGGMAATYKKNDEVGVCYFVFCTECCCETQYSRTEKEAISDWNRRTDKADNNKQLSFEQLKQRVGKPVYEANCKIWGIVDFDNCFPEKLFFCTEKDGVRFTWDIEQRELRLYDVEVSE